MKYAKPRCPLRPDDYCSQCVPGASGPQDCGLVFLVMDDPELKDLYNQKRRENQAQKTSKRNIGFRQ
uniref:DUF6767 domain-containing protein n=1 Tax=Vaginimicrobium propionicum TaxID=1871034 RepID=UPI000970FF0A|nr:DUF6767 domain-containing protein [Vaginimicrobium propionicum]